MRSKGDRPAEELWSEAMISCKWVTVDAEQIRPHQGNESGFMGHRRAQSTVKDWTSRNLIDPSSDPSCNFNCPSTIIPSPTRLSNMSLNSTAKNTHPVSSSINLPSEVALRRLSDHLQTPPLQRSLFQRLIRSFCLVANARLTYPGMSTMPYQAFSQGEGCPIMRIQALGPESQCSGYLSKRGAWSTVSGLASD